LNKTINVNVNLNAPRTFGMTAAVLSLVLNLLVGLGDANIAIGAPAPTPPFVGIGLIA